VKTSELELDLATMEERRHKESEESDEYEEFDMFHTDRNIVKGNITFKFKEDEEVPEWTSRGGDVRDGGDGAAHAVGQNSNLQEVTRQLLRGGCDQEEFQSFTQQ
jgi:hypothetical protein